MPSMERNGNKYTALTEEMRQQVKEWDFEDGWAMFHNGECEQFVVIDGVIHIQEDAEIEETKYYVLNVSSERCLSNGFRYIKELLLQDHNYRVYEAYETLKENGIYVYSVKTDALTIKKDDVAKTLKLLKVDEEKHKIGGWRLEKSKRVRLPTDEYKLNYNELVNVPQPTNERLNIEDEWDTHKICKQIIDCGGKCLIRGKVGGTGKSYIGEYFKNMGFDVLLVVPTNSLSQEKENEAITLNKFFSVPIEKGDAPSSRDASASRDELPEYDHSPHNVIVFDEVYMASMYMLNKIRLFCLDNPDKIIIATGDTKQLPPVEDITNCQDKEVYANQCLDTIFKHNIFLEISKRVKGEENRKIVNDMYADCWVNKLPLEELIKKHFETTDDVMTSDCNIAYTNNRCIGVSKEVRRRLGKTGDYEVGEVLVCRLYKKMGNRDLM